MRTIIALAFFSLLAAPAAAAPQLDRYDIPAHVSRVDGPAVIESAAGDDEVEPNLTLVEGDRIRTLSGRIEILFADGTLLHVDRYTVIDFQGEQFVRVMEGRVRWIVARRARTAVRVDTPSATVELEPGGDYRIAVAPNGEAELAVLRGAGALLNDHGDTRLRAGERAVVALGRAPSRAYYANAAAWDDFDRWSDARRREHTSAASVRYLPGELHPYSAVFDVYGSWQPHPSHGYVWYPAADVTWQPYAHGRWRSYPRYGWTWIGRDPWAWPTHHFGRWGFSAGAWFWIPGRSWGPAWVSWASSHGYVGWSPLGWDNRPMVNITNINIYNGTSSFPWCGWTFIRERSFGGRWRSTDILIGAGITTVVSTGIRPAASASIPPRRAVPRHGVAGGTAVPRGTAIPRPGLARPDDEAQGGLASVPNARPRRIPADAVRSTGGEGPAPAGTAMGPARRTPPADDRPVRREPPPTDSQSIAEPERAPEPRRAGARPSPSESAPVYPYTPAFPRGEDRPAPRARDREPAETPRPSSMTPEPSDAPVPRARPREPRGEGGITPGLAPPMISRPDPPRAEPRGPAAAQGRPRTGGDAPPTMGGERRAVTRPPDAAGGAAAPPAAPARRRGGG